jgi:hypothetical protein
MKAALILKGGPAIPNGDKLTRAGVKRCYFEANNPDVNAKFMQQMRGWGYEVGVMRDPVWNNYNDTPQQFIARVNADIDRLAPKRPDGRRPQLAVMLDIERHDPAYVLAALSAFRDSQPGRNVVWTMEYHQAGWFTPDLIDYINGYPQCKAVPQLYYGDMSNTVDSHASARDMAAAGVADARLCFFYSLRVPAPHDWDGVLYLENWTQLP